MIEPDKNQLKKFVEYYTSNTDFTEKSECQKFWTLLITKVFKIDDPNFIHFEKTISDGDHSNFPDVIIPSTRVLIEMKGPHKRLDENIKQSDGSKLTPYEQGKRYASKLTYDKGYEKFRWIVTSNFKEIWIYDTTTENPDPVKVKVEELWVSRWGSGKEDKELKRLEFLVDPEKDNPNPTPFASEKSAKEIGDIYKIIKAKEKDPEVLRDLTIFCVRFVFCLYCANTRLFDDCLLRDYIHDNKKHTAYALEKLFLWLNMTNAERKESDERLPEQLPDIERFPYIDGGLFKEQIEFARLFKINEKAQGKLMTNAIDVDWASINPVIFGSMFESTLESIERHEGGMYYTSEDNIKKVIKPLFLDELNNEHNRILEEPVTNVRNKRLLEFQDKIARLKFLDPACGSGNFLSLTYILLRDLENKILGELLVNGVDLGTLEIKIKLENFYGIEISEFATAVAQISMWIAEHKMLESTPDTIKMKIEFFPLKSQPHIMKANALNIDWHDICGEVDYIIGNPPYLGYSLQNKRQKQEMRSIYLDENGKTYNLAGKIDYVAAWYFKASELIRNTNTKCAFVSTNSITQGDQVVGVWKPLIERFGIHINFAYKTFKWFSKSEDMATVHCVIIGFSTCGEGKKYIYEGEDRAEAKNINPYLIDAQTVFIERRATPICNVFKMVTGNRPADGGNLLIDEDDYQQIIKKAPEAMKFIKNLAGAEEYINNKKRYCLWLVDAQPEEIKKIPLIYKRVKECRNNRLKGAPDRQELAYTPHLFREKINPEKYLIIPRVSSENRIYVPMGFLDESYIPTDSTVIIPNCDLYTFAVLTSSVHMAWMRAVCGRLEMRYRYSKDIVYNNFPWPTVTDAQKEKIARCGQKILDARSAHPDASLATLYDDVNMPYNLRQAHRNNDRAVMEAYGFAETMTESEIVAELMKMYNELVG